MLLQHLFYFTAHDETTTLLYTLTTLTLSVLLLHLYNNVTQISST